MSESYTQNLLERGNNAPEMSVSDLAQSLKRTLEDAYGRVRVRGELSRVKVVSSGHMYSDLKDENSVINVICWRGNLSKLSIRPEEGLDVICTGRITTYPQRSNYQLIIESMELAGEGALLKMLEERKKKLTAEGLFAEERKKALPFLPEKIGVVTSPTGAVIRDILHRISDRFPRQVTVWPVRVQGDGAAEEVSNAVNGFNALPEGQRPDLLIVARGGGSLEDLMPFNEENVVRAVANSAIPVISAVGHETDTTLVDYAADRRAPTPTGAAEMAVPERLMLLARVEEDESRLLAAITRLTDHHKKFVTSLAARLSDPRRLIEIKAQQIDHQYEKLKSLFQQKINKHQQYLLRLDGRLKHPKDRIKESSQRLEYIGKTLESTRSRLLKDPQQRLAQATRILETLSYQNVLKRGYSIVRNSEGSPVTHAAQITESEALNIEFQDGNIEVHTGSENDNAPKTTPKKTKAKQGDSKVKETKDQGSLF